MRIGFDGKRAFQNFTGLGNYSRYVLDLLPSVYPDNEYRVYAPGAPRPGSVSSYYPSGKLWRSFGISKQLKEDGIDLFHGLSNEIPLTLKSSGIPAVVTIHDLIFLRYPEYYPWVDRVIYRSKTAYAVRNSKRIIAISQQTKNDIQNFFDVPDARIQVVYQNCSPSFRQSVDKETLQTVKARYHLPDKFLLCVGTVEERKNQLLIVHALAKLTDMPLVIIGRTTSRYAGDVKNAVTDLRLKSRVHFLQGVTQADLPAIYRQADIFLYPSRFEGFGIPIVEALHSRVPVIAARGSCLEEAGGPGSAYVSPDDPQELADTISAILSDPERQAMMISKGVEYLDNFSDQKIAFQYMSVYKSICENA